jgi:hypothetical protein
LWERTFYEDGVDIADRIKNLVGKVDASEAGLLAIEARRAFNLRHVPLWIALAMQDHDPHRHLVRNTLYEVIQRPDEITETLSLWWKDGKRPIPKQIQKALAESFAKFDPYQIAKYQQRDRAVSLRDAMFVCHPNPGGDPARKQLYRELANQTLPQPGTWEAGLSSGKDKAEVFTELIEQRGLGTMATLRNLRLMTDCGVSESLIKDYLATLDVSKVFPYRFIAAAQAAPQFESVLDDLFQYSFSVAEVHTGHTALLVDVSGSMTGTLSEKSKMSRMDAACALAMIAERTFADVDVYSFSQYTVRVPRRKGFALRDAIVSSQHHSMTDLGEAVRLAIGKRYERIIVITDEQSRTMVPAPHPGTKAYMMNVAPFQNGVGYGDWTRIQGWSEACVRWIVECEKMDAEAQTKSSDPQHQLHPDTDAE